MSQATLDREAAAPAPVEGIPDRPSPYERTYTGTLVLVLLAGLALFDRPFGLLGVPGFPVYITEIVLAVGVVEIFLWRQPLHGLFRSRWLAPTMLVAYLGWGALRLATSLGYPVLDVLRDSALVYYSLFALLLYALSRVDRRFAPTELLRIYGRFVPWLLVIAPIRLVFAVIPSLQALPPVMPGSDVPFLGGHRPGNLGVQVGLAVVFLAANGRRNRATVAGIILGLMTIMLVGTQNRAGAIAAVVVIGVAMLLWGRRLRFRWLATFAIIVGVGLVAWGLDLHVSDGVREISVGQLMANAKSIVGIEGQDTSQLSDTESFRSQLWTDVLRATDRANLTENGWGFGPNLGSDFLPPGANDQALRNPHNSHLTILVRLGLVGALIWALLMVTWFWRVAGLARRRIRVPAAQVPAVNRMALLCSAAVAGILVNAFFDPTLESPMAAVWLWSVIGLGMAVVLRPSEVTPARREAPGRPSESHSV
jgi:O-antigen ligase